ncbi:hypothetical protein [Brevibacillus laterosporus]|uniref:hypothetical protein n=1 Tax=Brevibacillus laterosporus TaxID=1465 RepID=UPI0022A781FC|nr:hypothetical protein [Brevibacillus laterosporus]
MSWIGLDENKMIMLVLSLCMIITVGIIYVDNLAASNEQILFSIRTNNADPRQ